MEQNNSQIKTRIAPSPTGKLHIGTARTALFNFLFAKQNKGKFFLRFEDTDVKRSTKDSEKEIIEGFKWLGLNWDGEIIKQMDRLNVYKERAEWLVSNGLAYKKDDAIWLDTKQSIGYLKMEYKLSVAKKDKREIKSYFLNFDNEDLLAGKISGNVEDFVILRSNGIPTYHFAVVIDDEDMGITHVIRGADHFSNTPKHIVLQKIFNFNVPVYLHVPLTLNPERGTGKLSKRSGSTSIEDFKKDGYLPEALINFMVLLGWHPAKSEQEIFTMDELILEFSAEHMSKSNAVFDINKLDSINGIYIRKENSKELIQRLKDIMDLPKASEDYIEKVLSVIKDRMKKLSEFTELSEYFFKKPEYKPEILIFKKSDKEKTIKGLSHIVSYLSQKTLEWQGVDQLNKELEKATKEIGLSFGDVFWPVRVALSGREASPSPAELLWVLGKEESLKRIKKAIQLLS